MTTCRRAHNGQTLSETQLSIPRYCSLQQAQKRKQHCKWSKSLQTNCFSEVWRSGLWFLGLSLRQSQRSQTNCTLLSWSKSDHPCTSLFALLCLHGDTSSCQVSSPTQLWMTLERYCALQSPLRNSGTSLATCTALHSQASFKALTGVPGRNYFPQSSTSLTSWQTLARSLCNLWADQGRFALYCQ